MFDNNPNPKPQLVKKFYFLDYFLILLQSCELNTSNGAVFRSFVKLKEKEKLGESKYKKLTTTKEEDLTLSKKQVGRYQYTFDQVLIEAEAYNLIKGDKINTILTEEGAKLLEIGKNNKRKFYNAMCRLMESNYFAFYHLIKLCYNQNKKNNGLLIFPVYSPRKLELEKDNMRTNGDWYHYISILQTKLERDIEKYIDKKVSLKEPNLELTRKLEEDKILSSDKLILFDQKNYNAIIGRIRKFWLNYFLQNIYKYSFSFDIFNIWVERAKQIGIVNSTEFYPNFDGRLVYPTSIISDKNSNSDLVNLFTYPNGEILFAHQPSWEKENKQKLPKNQDDFLNSLFNCYFDMKRNRKTNFVQISELRERVCYKLKIPPFVFNDFLEKAYTLNIKGEISSFQISLEADRLPEETNALYLKREPVLINNQYKNIIAINIKSNE